jgi:DnaJ-class molecular chaperone
LSDPKKKQRYDSGQDIEEEMGHGHGHGMNVDVNQMFAQMFAGKAIPLPAAPALDCPGSLMAWDGQGGLAAGFQGTTTTKPTTTTMKITDEAEGFRAMPLL